MLGKHDKGKFKDEETKAEHKMSEYIFKMDDEIKDRFKAMKVIQDDIK